MKTRNIEEASDLIPQFKLDRLLRQDQGGCRVALLGTISSQPAILLVERAPFSSDLQHLNNIPTNLSTIQTLGNNDIYHWYLATSSSTTSHQPPNLKINLIYPCTSKHIKKYSSQELRLVTETPEIYRDYVRPYMQKQREEGRLNWVFNIIDGVSEQENVFYREHGEEGFVILPDLNWDRQTLSSLHVLGLVERRDIWSLRDLSKEHVVWLKHMKQKLLDVTHKLYPTVETDQLKCYVHYQPTYYHFHIHVVHVMLEAGKTQAVGKAFGLDHLIAQLESMQEGLGMADIPLVYDVGEQSDIWTEIFQPLKENAQKKEHK
ncbi:scavenger mRNA decapping enzyme [Tothia fuscella]|uniref:Scavenger mRNA decapping enzyme n=1 Tax=Tothia fuscella TaxID=1048955 RepID=A0A9P4NN07_9PEZI|nr:scavenger mRNA decapping enzyme [Tothia fuscella]